jgi:hypothetical protein
MGVTGLYRIEVGAFFATLVLLLGFRMAAGKISLRGLFSSEGMMRPERVLLFAATVLMGAVYIVRMMLDGMSSLPTLSAGWLVLFGMSCLIYLGAKAFRMFVRKS